MTADQVCPSGYVNSFRWQSIAVDRTALIIDWYLSRVNPTEAEQHMIDLHIRTTLQQDVDLVASVQPGLLSRGYMPGSLMSDHSEHGVLAIQKLVRHALTQ